MDKKPQKNKMTSDFNRKREENKIKKGERERAKRYNKKKGQVTKMVVDKRHIDV